MTTEFTAADFATTVLASDKPVLVDFWAARCPPCRMLGPIVDKLSRELAATVTIGKLDVDAHPEVAAEYGVEGIPALLLFKDGAVVGAVRGFQPEGKLREFIAGHVG